MADVTLLRSAAPAFGRHQFLLFLSSHTMHVPALQGHASRVHRGHPARAAGRPPARSGAAPPPRAYAAASSPADARPKVVVIGGGWAGFGAAKHLVEQVGVEGRARGAHALRKRARKNGAARVAGRQTAPPLPFLYYCPHSSSPHIHTQSYDVTLLDAAPDPGGVAAGWTTTAGRPMEAGIKGFWKHYPAIELMLRDLGAADALTDFEVSGFWKRDGRGQARLINEAPVFGSRPRLPTPLGQALWTLPYFRSLSLADRASVLPVMAALVDARSSPRRFADYDEMSAKELFSRLGATRAAYEEFLKPTLLVALFAPPEQLSAAETLAALEFYALRSQDAFDVRWCRGSVVDRIFKPLVRRIQGQGGRVLGGHRVTGVAMEGGKVTGVTAAGPGGETTTFPADAVVFAVGIEGMKRIVAACPALAARSEFRASAELSSVDCISVRLWLDRAPATQFPCNVLAEFDGPTTGGTFFNLNALQDEFKDCKEGVLAADWYGASALCMESDEALVARALANAAACEPGYRGAAVLDSAVARARSAVTHFSPGSLKSRPTQATTIPNAFIAGDWVKGVPTRADGLSQERALVTGQVAAGLVCEALGRGAAPFIPPVPEDEPHIAAAKRVATRVRGVADRVGLRSPFLP